jgi:hypothetical protein
MGPEAVRSHLVPCLGLVGRPRTHPPADTGHVRESFEAYNAIALRGLAWPLSLLPPHVETARTLGALVETSLRKVPGIGPANSKVANTAVDGWPASAARRPSPNSPTSAPASPERAPSRC